MADDNSSDTDNEDDPHRGFPGWGYYEEKAHQLLKEVGYVKTGTSENLIYNDIVQEFACIDYPDRMDQARQAALILKIMFKRWGEFGELDFDP
jgi:hypothetical protein